MKKLFSLFVLALLSSQTWAVTYNVKVYVVGIDGTSYTTSTTERTYGTITATGFDSYSWDTGSSYKCYHGVVSSGTQKFKLTAVPATGYEFVGWYDGKYSSSTRKSTNTTLETDRSFASYSSPVAHFRKIPTYSVSVSVNPVGAGTVSASPSTSISSGGSSSLSVTSTAGGYTFDGWYDGSTKLSSSANYTLSNITSNRTIVGKFNALVTNVTVAVDYATGSNNTMGTIGGGTTVAAGTNVNLTASANSGYYFKGWSNSQDGSSILSNSNVASYAVSASNTTYYAVFAAYKTSSISPTGSNTNTNWTTAVVPSGYVDLGLPSGTLWAKKNLGADSEIGYGSYYAWGSKTAKRNSEYTSTYFNYDLYDAKDLETSWSGNATYDAATAANASDVTPTKEDWQELLDNCTWEWNAGESWLSNGYVISNAGASIKLPTCGIAGSEGGQRLGVCWYWSATYKSGTGSTKEPYYLLGYGHTNPKVKEICWASSSTVASDGYAHCGMAIRPIRRGTPAYTLKINVKVGNDVVVTNTYRCDYGEKVQITASDVSGYNFVNWADNNSTATTREFTVTANVTYTVNYEQEVTYSVTFRTSAEDQNPAVKSDYHSGDLITNRPALDPQRIGDETHTYTFIGWLLEGTGNTYTNAQVDAMTVSGNMIFTARFDEQIIEVGPVTYNITIGNFTANANGQVVITSQGNTQTVSPSGGVFTFGAGKSVTIQAVPNAYYHFNGWVEDNDEEAVIDIRTLGSDLTYTPTFAANTTITLEDNHNQDYYTSLYSGHDGEVLTVIMQGRQLTEGSWMTFCAPFDFDIPAGHPFRGAVYELQDATMSGTNMAAYISLDFRRTYEMKANVPYLIVPTMTTLSDLEFDHVTIDAAPAQETVTAESGQVQFISLPWQTTLINDAQKPDFYLATGNNLRYVKTEGGTTFRAFRSYFHRIVNLGVPRRVVINLDGVETTKELTEDGEVVDVTEKRIENGILIIERNGVRYNAQGQVAE